MNTGRTPPSKKRAVNALEKTGHPREADAEALLTIDVSETFSGNAWLAPPETCPPAAGAINDYGTIKHMALPHGWVDGTRRNDEKTVVPGLAFEEYHPPDAPDAHLCLFHRAKPLNNAAADGFQEVLSRKAHDLTAQELECLQEVLMEQSDSETFALSSAHTEDLNGKKVLIVQGEYRTPPEQIYAVYTDSDGTCHRVQEIYFQAPPDQFTHYESEARKALSSIEWNSV